MILSFSRHRRFLDRLSAYIDGRLSPGQSEALEAHLAACPPCRRHLEELQATVLALRDLPQEEVPRSFALRPGQVVQPSLPSPAPRAPTIAVGMPLAGAALAFALAVLLVVDLGDLGGGGAQESLQDAAIPAEMAATQMDSEAAARGSPAAETAEPDADMISATSADAEEAAPAEEAPLPEAEVEKATGASPAPAEQAPALGQRGEGIDPLRAAEIALAATLALLVTGSLALAFAGRKR